MKSELNCSFMKLRLLRELLTSFSRGHVVKSFHFCLVTSLRDKNPSSPQVMKGDVVGVLLSFPAAEAAEDVDGSSWPRQVVVQVLYQEA